MITLRWASAISSSFFDSLTELVCCHVVGVVAEAFVVDAPVQRRWSILGSLTVAAKRLEPDVFDVFFC